MSKRWVAVALVAGVTAAVLFAVPTRVRSSACPSCYGMHDLGDGVWAETTDPHFRIMVDGARGRVEFFYGSRVSDPQLLLCATDACHDRLGRGGFQELSLLIAPEQANETDLTRMLSTVELHVRAEPNVVKLPRWFEEGLATLVAQDPRYPCHLPYEMAVGVMSADWESTTAHGNELPYQQAACVAERWARTHGQGAGLRNFIGRLERGDSFPEIVRPQPDPEVSPVSSAAPLPPDDRHEGR